MIYPSVMSPPAEPFPYTPPDWPRDANALTRELAEAILLARGLLKRPGNHLGSHRNDALRTRPPPDW